MSFTDIGKILKDADKEKESEQQRTRHVLLRGEFTLPSFLNILEKWSRMSSIPYKHETNNDVHNFILQHDIGRNFSFLIKELYQYT